MAAVQALYLMEITGLKPDKVIGDFISGHIPAEAGQVSENFDRLLFADVVRDVSTRRAEIDEVLNGCLDARWPLQRLEKSCVPYFVQAWPS